MKKILLSFIISLSFFAISPIPVRAYLMDSMAVTVTSMITGCSPNAASISDTWRDVCQGRDVQGPPTSQAGSTKEMNLGCWLGCREETNQGPGASGYRRGGAISTLADLSSSIIRNPPASAEYYVADLMHNAGFAPQAYAQGVGFGSLLQILPIWKAFRNITYFLFAIIFTIVGFAIMFRAKLNPQTVINIQTALPKLVITLILITFSYAIAGLMIDIMYLSTYVAAGAFSDLVPNTLDIAFDRSVFMNSLSLVTNGGLTQAADSVGDIVDDVIDLNVDDGVGGTLLEALDDILESGVEIIAFLVLAIAVMVGMFRTFFMLLSTYLQIIISVCFAPFQILMNAMPGSNSFMTWLKNLAGNLAVYPALVVVILLAHAFLSQGTVQLGEGDGGFSPPQLPGRGSPGTMAGLVGIGMILMMPEVGNKVKAAFGAGGGGGGRGGGGGGGFLGAFGGGALGAGLNPLKSIAGMGMGAYKQSILGSAMQSASGSKSALGYVGNAIKGGFGGAVNPVGHSMDQVRIRSARQKASDASIGFSEIDVPGLSEKRKDQLRQAGSQGVGGSQTKTGNHRTH